MTKTLYFNVYQDRDGNQWLGLGWEMRASANKCSRGFHGENRIALLKVTKKQKDENEL